MLLNNEIKHKEIDRTGISFAVDNYLANGGKINVIEQTVPPKDSPLVVCYKEAQAAKLTEQINLAHLRKQRAHISSLRACNLSDHEIMKRLELTSREFKRILG